jgi:hypothetical protein
MVAIPKRIGTKITLDNKEYGGHPRPYLGMSSSGEECLRKRWYGFHWASKSKPHSAQKERIFNIGHLFEALIIEELKLNGIEVFKRVDGKKIELFGYKDEVQEEMIGFAGHEKGHSDGRVLGVIEAPKTEHLLELKTMAQKYFLPLVKKGVKDSQPMHYSQMQRYMEAKKLKRALYIGINKNTSDIYVERIEFDPTHSEILCKKASSTIIASEPPARGYPAGFYKCGYAYCSNREICREEEDPQKNCRTCDHSNIEFEGKWTCSNAKKSFPDWANLEDKDEIELSVSEQRKGCEYWRKGWSL